MFNSAITHGQPNPTITSITQPQITTAPGAGNLTQVSTAAVPLVSHQQPLNQQSAITPPLQQVEQEFNKAVLRVAQYEGNIENNIRDNVERLFPEASPSHKEKMVAESVEKVAEANQAFEFNHLGNDLLEHPAVEYMSKSFLRRVLENLSTAQEKGLKVNVAKTSLDAGIGFLEGWSENDTEWAKQMNAVLSEGKANSRVLTTLAYHHMRTFRDPNLLKGLGDSVNQTLLQQKEANERLDIFQNHEAGDQPKMAKPITTQPHGWAWLKYADWKASALVDQKTDQDFIGERFGTDPHKGTGFGFKGMQETMKPAPYQSEAASLKERDSHESGYGGFVINDKAMKTVGNDQPEVSVNWRQQNMDKKLPMFAGPSSTTSYMYEVARLLKLPPEEAQPFRLMLLGWMIQPRDHSFTEIMGAFDAYAMEHQDKGQAVVDTDAKMAWKARENGDWLKAYEDLLTEDIDLPAQPAKTITLNGQEIHLPAQEAVKVSRPEFNQALTGKTDNSAYPGHYASDGYLKTLNVAIKNAQEPKDTVGLADEKIKYAPLNMDNLKLFNYVEHKVLPRPEKAASGEPFLNTEKDKVVTAWLNDLAPEDRENLLQTSASILAESTQASSISNVFHYNERNAIWETFLTVPQTNQITDQFQFESLGSSKDAFNYLLDVAQDKTTPEARQQAILDALGDNTHNQDTLMKGMLMGVSRFYTENGANVINPGYGDFAPPKDAEENQARLKALLKRNQYNTSAEREAARAEYNKVVDVLTTAVESPMFEQYSGKAWHGAQVDVANAAIEKGTGFKFPGFMSTTHDANVAHGYLQKGAIFQINNAKSLGAHIEGISGAPGEKEVLMSNDTSFNVERTYTIHMEKGEIPPEFNTSHVKRQIYIRKHGEPINIRVTTPDGKVSTEGEKELSDLIALLKKDRKDLDTLTVVVLTPEKAKSNNQQERENLLKNSIAARNQLSEYKAQRNKLKENFQTIDKLTELADKLKGSNLESASTAAKALISEEFTADMAHMLYNRHSSKESQQLKLIANHDYINLLTAAIKDGKIDAKHALDVLTENDKKFSTNQPGYLFQIAEFAKNDPKWANSVADLITNINDNLKAAGNKESDITVRMALLAQNSYRENSTGWQKLRNKFSNVFQGGQGDRDFYSKIFGNGKEKNLTPGAMVIASKLQAKELLPTAKEVKNTISPHRLSDFDRATDNADNFIKKNHHLITNAEYRAAKSSNILTSNIKRSNIDKIIVNELNKIDRNERSTKVDNQISKFERELSNQIRDIWDKTIKERKRKLSSSEAEFLNTNMPQSLIDEYISKAKSHPDFANLMKSQALHNHEGIQPEEIKIKPGAFDKLETEIAKLAKDSITSRVESLSDKVIKQAKSDYTDFKHKQEQQRQQQLEEQKRVQRARAASQTTSSRSSRPTSQPTSSFGGSSASKYSSPSTPKSSTTTSSVTNTSSSTSTPAPKPSNGPKDMLHPMRAELMKK
ncbi:hypothetical protein H0A36_23265 [Endozoicomonas sp. SM1973]|uniref:ADP ribosyltransferase domain-containing protein n=1 Tax=Spartinivicinus marinus TaxID=2994442 RepID=A0A853IFZ1_9GAMM|nr:ADP-ribosyltransferase domain-containing protein [Spartinivicinus marinus]MCX4027761.1 ADP-ribosyltransferase domain-containing protein [Spartinivicinus marinus]NYZ68944.1 hypothetical protein [Spartinivicinus marinus]